MTSLDGLKILAVSPIGGYGGNNTSIHRVRALESLGCKVRVIDSDVTGGSGLGILGQRIQFRLFRHRLPVPLSDPARDNARLLAAVQKGPWDVIWLEKALTINRQTLRAVRDQCPTSRIVGFSPDDMNARHNQSQQFLEALPHYDCFITTKTYNVDELGKLGCPKVVFVDNGFDPDTFRPLPYTEDDQRRLGGDVGFIGSFEEQRAEAMAYLAQNGVAVRVWGGGWHRYRKSVPNLRLERTEIWGDDYAIACRAFRINLGFLRKINRDQQTTRSVEIPACGGFMLAERTQEHQALFEEGIEAEFFSSVQELLEKCRFYLRNPAKRMEVAESGLRRCYRSGYSNKERLIAALRQALCDG